MEEIIEQLFSSVKLKSDLYTWLLKNYSDLNNIEINEIDDFEKIRTISISPNEPIHMFKIIVEYDKYRGLWYRVYIAIGKFTLPDENGLMKIEKAVAKLFYNSDLSLYDIDMFFDDLND